MNKPIRAIPKFDTDEEYNEWAQKNPLQLLSHNTACLVERLDALLAFFVGQQKMMANLGQIKKGMNYN